MMVQTQIVLKVKYKQNLNLFIVQNIWCGLAGSCYIYIFNIYIRKFIQLTAVIIEMSRENVFIGKVQFFWWWWDTIIFRAVRNIDC